MLQKSVDDLIHIAAAGGGFLIDVGTRSVDDLTRIAAAAAGTGARVILMGASVISAEDLVRIASAGRGAMIFE